MHSQQFKDGIGDPLSENREWIYRELAVYWRRLGYHEDEDWARVRYHRAKIIKELEPILKKDWDIRWGEFSDKDSKVRTNFIMFGIEEDEMFWKFLRKEVDWYRIRTTDSVPSFKKITDIFEIMGWLLLDILSKFGTSVWRPIIWSVGFWAVFGVVYSIRPGLANIQSSPVPQRIVAAFYYSTVTFATLGFGDIHPSGTLGQILATLEVLLGYIMLGVMVSVIARKMSR